MSAPGSLGTSPGSGGFSVQLLCPAPTVSLPHGSSQEPFPQRVLPANPPCSVSLEQTYGIDLPAPTLKQQGPHPGRPAVSEHFVTGPQEDQQAQICPLKTTFDLETLDRPRLCTSTAVILKVGVVWRPHNSRCAVWVGIILRAHAIHRPVCPSAQWCDPPPRPPSSASSTCA